MGLPIDEAIPSLNEDLPQSEEPSTLIPAPAPPPPTLQNTSYQELPENIDTLVAEVKKGRGRPKGSRNKNPLATNEIHATRSSHNSLINPEMATPDRFAREEMKKQEDIKKFFTPKTMKKAPIKVTPEDGFEVQDYVPTPPAEKKSSSSRIPIPKKNRSRSVDSSLILG